MFETHQQRASEDLSACPRLAPAFLGPEGRQLMGVVRAGWGRLARGGVVLCSNHYASVFSPVTRTPLMVIEVLSREQLADAVDEPRSRVFFEDARLGVSGAPRLLDYRSSGYDRGHLAPAANQPDQSSMLQSFVLSNIAPQEPHFNQRVWSKVEIDVRKYARRAGGPIHVVTGVLFAEPGAVESQGNDPLGKSPSLIGTGIRVPTHFFKLVVDPRRANEPDRGVWGWVMPNGAARMGPPIRGEALIGAGVPRVIVRRAMSGDGVPARQASL